VELKNSVKTERESGRMFVKKVSAKERYNQSVSSCLKTASTKRYWTQKQKLY